MTEIIHCCLSKILKLAERKWYWRVIQIDIKGKKRASVKVITEVNIKD